MSTKKKVQKQMEFYLSPSNLRQDKFLQQQMQLREDGLIDLEVFLTFNRIKQLGASKRILTEAVEKSPSLVLNAEKTHVGPKEMPDMENDDSTERTIYIENFPCGSDHDSLRRLFSPFGKVCLVSMPRFQGSHKFKGFAFIEFAEVESVSKALAAIKAKDEHAELAGLKGMAKTKWVQLRDSLKERMMQSTTHSATGTLKHAVETAAAKGTKDKDFFTPGLIVQLSNIPATASRKSLKAQLEEAAPVAFLDDSKLKFGGNAAYARFLSTSHTQKVLDHFRKTPLQVDGNEISIALLTGQDEVEYWTALVNKAAASKPAQSEAHGAEHTPAQKHNKDVASRKTSHIHFDNEGEEPPAKRLQHD